MLTTDIIPITKFNRGGAAAVFQELKNGPKIVVRNNVPVCVMMSPEEYDAIKLQLKEARLLMNAQAGKEGLTTLGKIMDEFGITEEDIEMSEDVEIE